MALVPVPRFGTLDDVLRSMPEGIAAHLRRGIALLSASDREKEADLIDALVNDIGSTGGISQPEEIAERYGYSEEDASTIGFMTGILVTFIAEREENPEEVSQKFFEHKLVDEENKSTFAGILERIYKDKNKIRVSLETQELSSQVLPSFVNFDAVVEMRFKFDNKKIINFVPVVVAHIGTDVSRHQLWLQLTKSDVNNLVRELQNLSEQISAIEELKFEK